MSSLCSSIALPLLICVCLLPAFHSAEAQTNNGLQYQLPAAEYSALVDLYNSTGGSGWLNADGWLDGNATSWFGVQINGTTYDTNGNVASPGYVVYLQLPSNNLKGNIPASLGNLTHLTYLWLSDNQLSGSIPASLGNLTNVWMFQMDNNQLSGAIPSSLGNLGTWLTGITMILGNNQLTGNIPASLCEDPNIQGLDLSYNQLSGSIPDVFSANPTWLTALLLNNNQLSGSIPASIGTQTHLYALYLNDNQFSGSIPASLGNITNTINGSQLYLTLSDNQLTGNIPESLTNLTWAQIDVTYNCLSFNFGSQNLQVVEQMNTDPKPTAGIAYEPQNTNCPPASGVNPGPLEPYKLNGCGCTGPAVGQPIRIATGNMYEEADDYATAGVNPLSFTRYYNSLADSNSPANELGFNWRSTYDRYLRISARLMIAERADGQELMFTNNGGGWTGDSDVDVQVFQSGSSWTLIDGDDTIETYNGSGLLSSIQARDGYMETMSYNSGNQLSAVTDSFNRKLQFTYQNNLLRMVTAPNGLVLTYSYTSSGVTPGVLDRLASVIYSTTPSTSQSYLYENSNLPFALTGIIDEDGDRYATWTYDSSGRATSSQLGNGDGVNSIVYNSDGSRNVTGPLGLTEVYKFTTLQGAPKVTEIDRLATASVPAATMTYSYDYNGNIDIISDWNTNLTTFVNDTRGEPLNTSEAVGTISERTTLASYASNFHLPVQIIAPRETTVFAYDTNGNPLTITETDTTTQTVPYSTGGQARSWTNTYDNLGHLLTSTGPRTDLFATNRYSYDTSNDLITITDPLGHLTRFTNYNGSGLPGMMIDPNGVVATFAYDVRNRLLSRTVQAVSGNATDTFGYDSAGQLTSVTLPNDAQFNYQYDAAHRLESVSNLLGESIIYLLDAAGDVTNQTIRNSAGQIVNTRNFVFDQLGRPLQQIGAYSETTTFGYDSDGNRTSVTDPRTNTTAITFDSLNRPVFEVDPLNNSTDFIYDQQNNLNYVVDPRFFVTGYAYDGFGRVIGESSPDQGGTAYALDLAGNRTAEEDARSIYTLRTFDALNRVTSETYPANTSENNTYTYDVVNGGNFGVGRLTSYTDESGSTTLAYNGRADVISTTRSIYGQPYTITYGYDLADNVTNIIYPSGHVISYARDNQGRISAVMFRPSVSSAPTTLASDVTYEPFGPLSGLVYGNGLVRSQIYDQDYRLKGIITSGAGGSVQNLSLGYDTVNEITSIADNLAGANTQSFNYDADYRLVQAGGVYGQIGYTYDADGNRLTSVEGNVTETNSYSLLANLLQSTVVAGITRSFTYTPNGNVETDNRGSTTNLSFIYGNRNRYNQLWTGSTQLAFYGVNALGERDAKYIMSGPATGATDYLYDEHGHLIAEAQPNGTLVREYVWLDDMPLAQIEANGTIYYIHPDQLNSPQKMTSATQAVVWSIERQPFGETVPPSLTSVSYSPGKQFKITVNGGPNYNYVLQASTGLSPANWTSLFTSGAPFTFTDTSASTYASRFYRVNAMPSSTNTVSVTQNLRFPGQYYDAESGLNYNMMRDYDPSLGRYIEADPIGLGGGINLYGYAKQSPANYFDKNGQAAEINSFSFFSKNWAFNMVGNFGSQFNDPGQFDVIGHGDPNHFLGDGTQDISPENLARMIYNDPKYKPGMPVVLHACNTGVGNNSYAKRLQAALAADQRLTGMDQRISTVYAPNGYVVPTPWGDYVYKGTPLFSEPGQYLPFNSQ